MNWCQQSFSVQLVQLELNVLNSEFEPGQTDARGVLVILLFNVSTGRLYEDVFIVGSFTEHWARLPPNRGVGGVGDLHAILLVFAFALASCEARFMMLGEFMYLSCLRSGL